MALIAHAETAQDIAAGLNKFLDSVPEHSTEITALISECFAISSALRELTTAIGDSRYNRRYHEAADDITITLRSLEYTFEDVRRLFGGLGRADHFSEAAAYRAVWTNIIDWFHEESSNSLCRRLEYYSRFLLMLTSFIERVPPDPYDFKILRDRIDDLLQAQEDRLADNMNDLSLGSPAAARVRSFERRRPQGLGPPSPPSPDLDPIPRRRHGPQSPLSPGFDQEFRWNPPAPEVPNSPITTNTSSTSQSSRASFATSHWVPRMFEQSRPTTGFHNIGQVSVCLGEDSSSASSRLAEDYEKLAEIPFERGDLLVRFYLRPSDQRARILCRTIRPSRARKQSCLPLTSLRIQRVASCLKLCRMDRSGRSVTMWANLRFPSYEHLILFHCTFLALKAEDSENRVRGTVDDELHGEKEYFGGLIIDDHYEHALRVFKDRDSGGIRLQASVRGGDLKRTPVWTAFITHLIASRTWMWRDSHSSKTVYLADLQRFIFTEEYTPQLGPDGEHELRFKTSKYALDFMEAIDDLARPRA